MAEGKKHKIGNIAAFIFIAIAGIFDLFTLIPVIGDFLGPIFWVGASLYFWKSGLGFVNGRRLATSAISMIAEMIPGVQELPAILAGIVIVITMTRFEEKTGISVSSITGGKVGTKMNIGGTRMPTPRTPLNQGNVRSPSGGLAGN